MKSDFVRPFAPGLKKFLVCLLCLHAIGLALLVNAAVAFALVMAACSLLIKYYQVDPEPILLLFQHLVVSTSMLCDPITTLAVITVFISGLAIFRDFELPRERLVVFLLSTFATTFFGNILAVVVCVCVALGIIFWRLRPLRPETVSVVALGGLGLSLLVSKVAGWLVLLGLVIMITTLFIFSRFLQSARTKDPDPQPSLSQQPHHPNGYLALSNITESLDLHGHTVTGAMKALHEFLREHEDEYRRNRAQHIRHVTIITGEGNHSNPNDSTNLVKPTVINFLKINKYKYETPSDCPGVLKVDLESHIL